MFFFSFRSLVLFYTTIQLPQNLLKSYISTYSKYSSFLITIKIERKKNVYKDDCNLKLGLILFHLAQRKIVFRLEKSVFCFRSPLCGLSRYCSRKWLSAVSCMKQKDNIYCYCILEWESKNNNCEMRNRSYRTIFQV